MALDSKHPLYGEYLADWTLLRDCYLGERRVKEQGLLYLPATSGMHADGMLPDQLGWKTYQAYKTRAIFHDFVKDAVETLIGVMHHKPADIQLPPRLEPLRERATIDGESLLVLLRRINEAQLVTGRIGLLLDIPANPPAGVRPLPYVATYKAEDILNWDRGRRDDETLQTLNFVSLDESEYERKAGFEWELVSKYRVLLLGDPDAIENADQGAKYRWGVFRKDNDGDFSTEAMQPASLMGRELEEIPFVFINSKDIVPEPDAPPLAGLARLSMAIYRGEADYRQALFMQGQDTLVVIGGMAAEGERLRVGAGTRLDLPIDGDAKYIGVSSKGLSEMRAALEADKKQAAAKGGQLLDTTSREKESGDALRTRVSAQTATLNQIALAGAFGLQSLLRIAAKWVGADPEEVIVTPNLDFDDTPLTGKDLVEYVSAKNMGGPIARKTIHDLMRRKGVTELTFEEEMKLIEEEEPMGPTITLPANPNDEGDPDDPDDEGDEE